MENKIVRVTGYGLFCLSVNAFELFLRTHKIKSKKLNKFFDKEKNLLEKALQEGSWLPISKISSVRYLVDVNTKHKSFNDDWTEVLVVNDCNLHVGEDSAVWIGTLDMLDEWNAEEFNGKEVISYQTMDGKTLYKAFKFDLKSARYKISIKGYKKNEIVEYTDANYGFLFQPVEVDTLDGFTNPLTQNLNIAKM